MKSYVEHANISVVNARKTIEFLTTAIPEWTIRGCGKLDDWFGRPIEWFHVGDEHSYIAISDGGDGDAGHWTTHFTGMKHLGIVVPDVDALVARLKEVGYELDHWGAEHPFRKNVYYLEDHGMQFEFVEYLSDKDSERNDYTQQYLLNQGWSKAQSVYLALKCEASVWRDPKRLELAVGTERQYLVFLLYD